MCRNFFLMTIMCCVVSCEKMDFHFKPAVAAVNGSKIYLEDYQRELKKKMCLVPEDFLNRPDDVKKIEEEVLDGMITEKIMLLRAAKLNISVNDGELENKIHEIRKDYGEDFSGLFSRENISYEAWKEQFKKEMLLQKLIDIDVNSRIKISENEALDYYNRHQDRYKTESRVRVSQIVVRDMSSAQKALERLRSGEAFARVAAEMSIAPEAKQGGDLGFVTQWFLPEPLDKTVFNMPVHKISPIVKSSYGYHIFKVSEHHPARSRSFDEVKKEVIADLRLQKEDEAFALWLEELKKKAVIKKEKNIKNQ